MRKTKQTSIEISEQQNRQLRAFKPVVDAVLEEELTWDVFINTVLQMGLNRMLMDIIGKEDNALVTLRKLAELEPESVYKLIAIGFRLATEQERADTKRRLEECKNAML